MLPLAAVLSCLGGLSSSSVAVEVEDPRVRDLLVLRLFDAGYVLAPDPVEAGTVLRVVGDATGWDVVASGRVTARYRVLGRTRGALTALRLQQYSLLALEDSPRIPRPSRSHIRVLSEPDVPADARTALVTALLSLGRHVSRRAAAATTVCVGGREARLELRQGKQRCRGTPWRTDPRTRGFRPRLRRWLKASDRSLPTSPTGEGPASTGELSSRARPPPLSSAPVVAAVRTATVVGRSTAVLTATVARPARVLPAKAARRPIAALERLKSTPRASASTPPIPPSEWGWRAQTGVQLHAHGTDLAVRVGLRFQRDAWGLRADVGWTGAQGASIAVHEGLLAAGPEWSWALGPTWLRLGPRLGLFLHGYEVVGRSGLRLDAGADLPVSVEFRLAPRLGLELTAVAGVVFRDRRTHRLDGAEIWRREPWHFTTLLGIVVFP